MKTLKNIFLVTVVAVLMLAVASTAQAQAQTESQQANNTPVAVYQPPCPLIGHSHATGVTITITPPPGQFVYICGLDYQNCQGTAVTAAAPTHITSTGIGGGTTPDYLVGSGPATAGTCSQAVNVVYPSGGLRSNTQGAAVTWVMPTFVTNQVVGLNVYYRYGY